VGQHTHGYLQSGVRPCIKRSVIARLRADARSSAGVTAHDDTFGEGMAKDAPVSMGGVAWVSKELVYSRQADGCLIWLATSRSYVSEAPPPAQCCLLWSQEDRNWGATVSDTHGESAMLWRLSSEIIAFRMHGHITEHIRDCMHDLAFR